MEPTNSYTSLPIEAHFKIQTHLDRNSLANYARINHAHNEMITFNNNLWKSIFPEITFPDDVSAKTYLDKHATTSTAQILERIAKFAAKLKFGQKGTFACLFPFNPKCHLNVQFKTSGYYYESSILNFSSEKIKVTPEKSDELKDSYVLIAKIEDNEANDRTSMTISNNFSFKKSSINLIESEGFASSEYELDFSLPKINRAFTASLKNQMETILKKELYVKYRKITGENENFIKVMKIALLFIGIYFLVQQYKNL